MRRALTVIAIILAVLILAGAVFYFTQRDQIDTLVTVATVPEEELVRQREEAQAVLEDELTDAGLDLDAIAEHAEAIDLSEQTEIPEDFSQLGVSSVASSGETDGSVGAVQTPDKPTTDGGGVAVSPAEKTSAEKAVEKTIKKYSDVESILAYFYAMQSSYQGQLDGIRAGAIAQYKALPEEERTTANKIAIARGAYSTAVSLESGCDAQIAELSDRLRDALKREGMNPAIADQIVSYYVSAKNAQKAAYLSQYKKYLS